MFYLYRSIISQLKDPNEEKQEWLKNPRKTCQQWWIVFDLISKLHMWLLKLWWHHKTQIKSQHAGNDQCKKSKWCFLLSLSFLLNWRYIALDFNCSYSNLRLSVWSCFSVNKAAGWLWTTLLWTGGGRLRWPEKPASLLCPSPPDPNDPTHTHTHTESLFYNQHVQQSLINKHLLMENRTKICPATCRTIVRWLRQQKKKLLNFG